MRSEDTDETILSGGIMNNYEKIKNMTLDEMAEHHYKFTNSFIIAILKVIKEKTGVEFEELPSYENVISDIKQWLESEG